jgi:hypothetical protein
LIGFEPTTDFRLKRVVIPLLNRRVTSTSPSPVKVIVVGTAADGSLDPAKQWGSLLYAADENNHQMRSDRSASFNYVGDIYIPAGERVYLRVYDAPDGTNWMQPSPRMTQTEAAALFDPKMGFNGFHIGQNMDSA